MPNTILNIGKPKKGDKLPFLGLPPLDMLAKFVHNSLIFYIYFYNLFSVSFNIFFTFTKGIYDSSCKFFPKYILSLKTFSI